MVEDVFRATEKDHQRGGIEVGNDESVLPGDAAEYTHQKLLPPDAYYGGGESEDSLRAHHGVSMSYLVDAAC